MFKRIVLEKYGFETEGVHAGIVRMDLPYEPRGEYELCLKVFKNEKKPLEEFMWKHTTLLDATRIQNILWKFGFAPRVYAIVEVETPRGLKWGQIVEYLPDSMRGSFTDKRKWVEVKNIMKKFGIGIISFDPNPKHKYIDKIVDISQLYFKDDIYKNWVIQNYAEKVKWGSNPLPYQSVPELGIKGQRSAKRFDVYDFDSVDFKDKSVVDFGCSGGSLCREAIDRGAKYCVGVDRPDIIDGAWHLNNYLGYWNIDFRGGDFSCKDGVPEIEDFDIALYMSAQQLGFPKYLKDKVDILYLEGHSGDHKETYEERLREMFSSVEFLGASKDHSIRPVFRCNGRNK